MFDQTISFEIILEIIGYIGSAFVVISMLMTSVVKLRLINMVGSVISIIYAFIVKAYPLALMNFCLVVINAINLIRLFKSTKEYSVVKISGDEAYSRYFLETYNEDIKKFFPDSDISSSTDTYLVCCGTTPAGIISGKRNDTTLNVSLDYATPMYRDCSVGKFIYAYLAGAGVKKLVASASCDSHRNYLKKMGFTGTGDEYTKQL